MSPSGRLLLPVVGRHLVGEFLRGFALALAAFVAIYLIAEFFDEFDDFLRHDVPIATVARYFAFKVPLVVTQVAPVAVLAGGLAGLGMLARQNEFVALRACGVSIWQIAVPLLGVAAAISVLVFVWNESLVPYSAHKWHTIKNLEIRKRGTATVFTGREVWYHGRAGFYNIDRVNLNRRALYGLTVYQVRQDFSPIRIVEADSAYWDGQHWEFLGVRTREFGAGGGRDSPRLPEGFNLPETLDDFRAVSVEPEELSFAMLRRQIKDLRRKGVDTSESWVDLHLKLALPVASLMMMLVAVPLAAAGTRVSSVAASMAVGFVVGFSYFVVVAFARALGQSGALPPAVAAWAANGLFALVGGYYVLGTD